MRLLIALAFVAIAAASDIDHEIQEAFYQPEELVSFNCDPGYTGQDCNIPICYETNEDILNQQLIENSATIDTATLKNCTQNYVLYIDDKLDNIRILIQTDFNINPMFKLQNQSGAFMQPSDVLDTTQKSWENIYYILPFGQYLVIPSADLQNNDCFLTVTAQAYINIGGGFIQNSGYNGKELDRWDFPLTLSLNTGYDTTVVFHAIGNRAPGSIDTVRFNTGGNDNFRGMVTATKVRYNCGYEYYVDHYICNSPGVNYTYTIQGVTFAGYTFRRTNNFFCFQAPVTTPPTTTVTTPAPLTRCHNGGVMLNNTDGSRYCYCQGLWSGRDCSEIVCLNGGTPLIEDEMCRCPGGYNGNNCENVFCYDPSQNGFDANSPTLTFVIRTSSQIKTLLPQITSAISDAVKSYGSDTSYFQQYVLVTFMNDQFPIAQRYFNLDTMFTDLNNTTFAPPSSSNCTDAVFTAITKALNMYLTNTSPMFIFTDATPWDVNQYDLLITQLSFWRVPLHFVFLPTGSCGDDATYPYRKMLDVSQKSSGNVYYVTNTSNNNLDIFLYNLFKSTIYRSQLILGSDFTICSNMNKWNQLAIDISTGHFSIIATGTNMNATIMQPDGKFLTLNADYNDGSTAIWQKKWPQSGNFYISFSSSNPMGTCGYRVYQVTELMPSAQRPPQYNLFWAFTNTLDGDGEFVQPLWEMPLSITAHLTNYPPIPMQYVNAALSIWASRNGGQTLVYASNGMWRDGCSYNFYFPPFTCRSPDETLYFTFYARDHMGMAIQRAGTMSCMLYVVTPMPPNGCQNGGIMNPSNTTCYCQMGYSGQYCQNVDCYNGGTPMGSFCSCPIGWGGPICTIPKCLEPGPNPEFIRNYVDMIFAVEVTQGGFAQITSLNQYFAELLRDIQSQDQTWIRNYVLTGYNSTWGDIIHVSPSWNPKGIIDALNKLANTHPTDPGCNNVKLYQALDTTFSPADQSNSGGWDYMYNYMREYYLQLNGFLAFNPRSPTYFFCNATQDQFQLLFDIVGGSGGTVYPTQNAEIAQVIKVIPLQYSSGTVYYAYNQDCSAPYQIYFPVDAYTQTIEIYTVGNTSAVQVYNANGVLQNDSTFHNVMHDSASGWDIWEVRRPCDSNWQEFGQYCFFFEREERTWQDAKTFCQQAGGLLVDDLNQSKHVFLSEGFSTINSWIGLFNNGSEWLWDRGASAAVPLSQDTEYWNSGIPPAYNPNASCVYWLASAAQAGNTWVNDDCTKKYAFACQKHRYDQNYTTNSLNTGALPAGRWYMTIQTSGVAANQKSCFAQVRVQSNLQLVTGFTLNQLQDFPDEDPINDSPNNRFITYIHTLDNEHRTPLLTHAALWDAYNGTFYNGLQYYMRENCNYKWLTDTFVCPNSQSDMNEFGVYHFGEDEFGNAFQRVSFGHCAKPVLTCGVGGIRSQNGTCVCNEYYTGRYCTIPICVNNGTLTDNEQGCICPSGFDGPNCQYYKCNERVPYHFTDDQRTLLIILEETTMNQPAYSQLANNFAAIYANMTAADPSWFSTIDLITFNSAGITYSNFKVTDPTVVQAQIAWRLTRITDPGNCTLPLYNVLAQTLRIQSGYQSPNSQILLFTSSGASDLATRVEALEQISNAEIILNWIYSSSTSCGSEPSDPSLFRLVALAYESDGNVAFVDPTTLTSFLSAYLPTRYQAQPLHNPTLMTNFSCPVPKSWFVEVDHETQYIYATVTAAIGTLSAISGNNKIAFPQQIYSNGLQSLYRLPTNGVSGIYTFSLSSPGACFVSIWGTGGVNVFIHYAQPTLSDPTGAHTDGTSKSPMAGVQNTAVLHVDFNGGTRAFLQGIDVFDQFTNTFVARSDLYQRNGCAWEYVSDPFTCLSDSVLVMIYGMDEWNQQFRRYTMAWCLNGTLPTAPIPTTSTQLPPTSQSTLTTSQGPVTTGPTQPSPTTTQPTTTSTQAITATPTTGPTQGVVTTTQSPTTPPTPGVTTTPSVSVPTTTNAQQASQMDVVFLLDVSQAAANLYDDMSSFVNSVMAPYAVGTNAHVDLIPVTSIAADGIYPFTDFTSITSNDILNIRLAQMKQAYIGDFSVVGQYLQEALNAATMPTLLDYTGGYRANITNHALIYVTATTDFSDNPSTQSILQNNTYGVITVGYGNGIGKPSDLATLAGGAQCSILASQKSDLLSATVIKVQALLNQGGTYCGNGSH